MSELEALGWDEAWAAESVGRAGTPARVVRQDRGWVLADTGGEVVRARSRTDRTGGVVVGDWVLLEGGEVVGSLARRRALRRADPVGEGEQVFAANVDGVLVVAGLDRPVKEGRIQRALAQVHDAGAEPVVVLTKSDLVPDPEEACRQVRGRHPGVEVVSVSAVTRHGLSGLADGLGARTVVLLGESGAGKSTLLNALAGYEVAETGEVRATDAKGRHTTTRRELHLLPGGTCVIDTPGIRAMGMFAEPGAIDAAFPDIDMLAADCRFGDCSHDKEPGCAVLDAVRAGELRGERLDAYKELHAESAWAQRSGHHRRRRGR